MSQRSIYLDYQASTPLDARVKAVMDLSDEAVGNPSSEEHAFGWQASSQVECARAQIANTIGAATEEIIFTSGATEANNIGVLGSALGAPASRRRILISALEHKSVIGAAEAADRFGFTTEFIEASADGLIRPETLAAKIDDNVAVVSIMAVNNEIGTIQSVPDLAQIARKSGAFFHVDGTQALAAMKVDVVDWGVDAFSLSGHKIYGPKGIGALFVASDAPWRPEPLLFGGGQQGGLRPGTLPTGLCAGLGEACRLLDVEGADERIRVARLRDYLFEHLRRAFPDARMTCAKSPRHPGSLHVRFPGIDASDLLLRLQPRVAASTGSACTSGIIGPSHVNLSIGFSPQEASECLRFSVGRFSTVEELDEAADAIQQAIVRTAA